MPNGLPGALFCRIAGTILAITAAVALTACNDSSSGESAATPAATAATLAPETSATLSPTTGSTTSAAASPGTILTAGSGDSASTVTTSENAPTPTTPADGTQEALLSWIPPVQNTDGTELDDLAGYRVYAGQDPAHLTDVADLVWGGYLWVRFTDLNPGTWYFSIRSYNSEGIESDFAPTVSKEIV